MICGIYSITAPNGKRYIGLSKDIETRWRQHLRELREGSHHNVHLQCAWNLYGEDGFEFIVLQEVPVLLLDVHEVAWIQRYDTTNPEHGYNMTSGGSRPRMSKETRAKLSARIISAETRAKMSARRHSAETRAKMSSTRKGVKHGPRSPETCAALSAALLGKKRGTPSPETRAKISATLTGKKFSEEHRTNMSIAITEWWAKNRI